MKKLTVLLATFFVFFTADAQQILAGIYSGSMYNDSTKMLQKYELALSEYRGKVFGYSYVTFVVNDTFYYGIRRVKGYKNDKNELVLTDEELLANNFPESPAKRVKRTATFPLAQEDTITNLSGTWQTNRTRQYYSVGGATKTERSVDSAQSPLVAHLQELKIIAGQPDYQDAVVAKAKPKKEEKKNEVAKTTPEKPADARRGSDTEATVAANNSAVPGKNKTTATDHTTAGTNGQSVSSAPNGGEKRATTPDNATAKKNEEKTNNRGSATTEQGNSLASGNTETPKSPVTNKTTDPVNTSTAGAKASTGSPASNGSTPGSNHSAAIAKTTGANQKPGQVKPTEGSQQDIARKSAANDKGVNAGNENKSVPANTVATNNQRADATKPTGGGTVASGGTQPAGDKTAAAGNKSSSEKSGSTTNPVITTTEKPAAVAAAAPLEQRSTTVIKTLEVVSDSITLSFYDNGVVDGDVISVFVNGQNILASARLTEVAMKKTIHLPTFAGDSVQVTLVAETLGSIPPNTGLLLVYDGDKRYDVRFAADMQTNASIVFRKGKK